MPFDCSRCGASFPKNQGLTKHLARKTPCAPILDKEDLPEEKRDAPNRCRFCGRVYSRSDSLARHLKQACKIAPRNGDTSGMDKLYEHTLRRQEEKHKAEMAAVLARLAALETQVGSDGSKALIAKAAEARAPNSPTASSSAAAVRTQIAHVSTMNAVTNIDNSVGKTTVNVNINIFGRENIDRVTKPQVFDILRGLGPVGDNVKAIAEKAIIQAAMLIFSDPAHPEDLTCYLPNKKGDNALVHGETGWEVQPVGLVISPMAAQSIETLFKHQPAPDESTPANDVKWMMEECGRIMRYIADHEGIITNEPPRGEMRGILIRNKDLLQQVLAKLPLAGGK